MKKLSLLLALSAIAGAANAVTLFDSAGFEGYTVGSLTSQNNWTSDFTTTTYNVASGTSGKYVTISGSGTNWAYPTAFAGGATSYTPAANERVLVDIDIARTVGSTGALSTANYGIDVYSGTGSRVTSFGLTRNSTSNAISLYVIAPFNTTTGAFGGTTNFVVSISSALTAGSFYNLEAQLNFAAKSVDIYSGGSLFLGNIPFAYTATGTQASIGDADIYMGSGTGNDTGAFDNYRVSTQAVPEPSALAALGLGAVAVLRRRKKA